MQELSMNILDIAENSVKAGAAFVDILLDYRDDGVLVFSIKDDGSGMSDETLHRVTSPFFTSRTTRNVGLGLPFLKMAAEQTGGGVEIDSALGKGTAVTATFDAAHIDMMPLGDIGSSISALISGNPSVDFIFALRRMGKEFTVDSREIKQLLEGVPVDSPQVAVFIREYVNEHAAPILGE